MPPHPDASLSPTMPAPGCPVHREHDAHGHRQGRAAGGLSPCRQHDGDPLEQSMCPMAGAAYRHTAAPAPHPNSSSGGSSWYPRGLGAAVGLHLTCPVLGVSMTLISTGVPASTVRDSLWLGLDPSMRNVAVESACSQVLYIPSPNDRGQAQTWGSKGRPSWDTSHSHLQGHRAGPWWRPAPPSNGNSRDS